MSSRRAGASLIGIRHHSIGIVERWTTQHARRPFSAAVERRQQAAAARPSPPPPPPTTQLRVIQATSSPRQPAKTTPQATQRAQPPQQPPPQPPQPVSPSPDPLPSLTDGLLEPPPSAQQDWTRSYHGLSSTPFPPTAAAILQTPIPPSDIEIKPDGIIYLPEIKYRRILNAAFGPGGWGLAPRGETLVSPKSVSREYALVCGGRLVSIARGEQSYFDSEGVATATEGCKSNALMRCCKDLGVASELWDPRFVRAFLRERARELVLEHVVTRKRRRCWMRRDDEVRYPFKEVEGLGGKT